jgi:lariat debranching enzyme
VFEHEGGAAAGNVPIGGVGEGEDELGAMLAAELAKDDDGQVEEDDVDREDAGDNPDEIVIEDEEEFDEVMPVPTDVIAAANPEEIRIDDDDFDEPSIARSSVATQTARKDQTDTTATPATLNPEEIPIDSDEFDNSTTGINGISSINAEAGPSSPRKEAIIDETVDVVENARAQNGSNAGRGVIGVSEGEARAVISEGPNVSELSGRRTKFLALDKCGPGKDFIQVSRPHFLRRNN